ncbi:MAG: molybdopterin oxidoreductase family protein [Alphaproteobacteria bacterium]|nr:molybdopterin oxidoreductase family protein [Alphaproteobacteria bacterium]
MSADFVRSACPHDCPSACALEVERLGPQRIGRVRGARDLPFTAGVVCEKVARYAERVHHPDRLSQPLHRVGARGEGQFEAISWNDALDEVAEAFTRAAQTHGPETVWPYHSGGTLGLIQRYGQQRLTHAMGYSRQKTTICITPSESGWRAGVGEVRGVDPCEAADADLIVVWGGNPVATNVNLMSHIQRARKQRGAKLAVIDVYATPTVESADRAIILRPGTDGALALAMMNVILAEGLADQDFLARLTDFDDTVARHIATRTPDWAAAITGVPAEEIVDFARAYGHADRAFLRLGLGFTRARNGAAAMHAVTCLPALTGAWKQKGGGAFFAHLEGWGLDLTLAHGLDRIDPATRILDQSRIGAVLAGETDALAGGPQVTAMLMQNANSADVAPDSRKVRAGLTRPDLFLCVHEQFMTSTARCADIVLPATTFLEHDDLYMGWGHTALTIGRKVIEPHAEARSNHEVICGLAKRLGGDHPGFAMSAWELVDATLRTSGKGGADEAAAKGWIDCAEAFERMHFLTGFPNPQGRFRFKPRWDELGPYHAGMPTLPDHWEATDAPSEAHPMRLVAPPARRFLNTSFSETPGSRLKEDRPTAMLHPDDAARLGVGEGDPVRLGNVRGELVLEARIVDGTQPGVVVAEGIWPGRDFGDGLGINQLTADVPVAPAGGVAFHDTAVWLVRETAAARDPGAIAAE